MDLKPILITGDKAEEFFGKLEEAVKKEKDSEKENNKADVSYTAIRKEDIKDFFK